MFRFGTFHQSSCIRKFLACSNLHQCSCAVVAPLHGAAGDRPRTSPGQAAGARLAPSCQGGLDHAASQGPLLSPGVWPAGFATCMVWPTLGAYSPTRRQAPCPPARPREPHDSILTREKPALNFVFTLESEFLWVAREAAAKGRKGKRRGF